MQAYPLLAAYAAVFLAEMVGDRSVYTVSALATRFRPAPVFCGIVLAFMGKMLAAVLFGRVIARLPAALVAGVSAATFLVTAVVLWQRRGEPVDAEPLPPRRWKRGLAASFAAIFFSEWADVGQITAAVLAARLQAPLAVWVGATLALVTKGGVAVTLGWGLRRYVSHPALRYLAFLLCLAMSALAILRI